MANTTEKNVMYDTKDVVLDTNSDSLVSGVHQLSADYDHCDGIAAVIISGEDTASLQIADRNKTYFEIMPLRMYEPSKNYPQDQRFITTNIPAKGNNISLGAKWDGALTAGSVTVRFIFRLKK